MTILRSIMEELLRITLSPSFEPTTTLRLEREPGQDGRTRYCVTCKESRSYRPDSESRKYGMSAETAEEIMKELDALDPDARLEEAFEPVGTPTKVRFRRGTNTVMLSWSGDVPREWAGLNKVINLLEHPPGGQPTAH